MHMPSHVVDEVLALEERLRIAMLAADCDALDQLISSELIFTDHLGWVFGKQDDLGVHRSGMLKFNLLQPSEMKVSASSQLAVVSVRMKVTGTYDDAPDRAGVLPDTAVSAADALKAAVGLAKAAIAETGPAAR